jgi:hypothetical protein
MSPASRRPNRAPMMVWTLRKDHQDSVRTLPGDRILIRVGDREIETDRATARLLVRRIVQCLDGTAIR